MFSSILAEQTYQATPLDARDGRGRKGGGWVEEGKGSGRRYGRRGEEEGRVEERREIMEKRKKERKGNDRGRGGKGEEKRR